MYLCKIMVTSYGCMSAYIMIMTHHKKHMHRIDLMMNMTFDTPAERPGCMCYIDCLIVSFNVDAIVERSLRLL